MALGKTNGYYTFCAGFLKVGSRSQPKFYLGKDEQQAELRSAYIKEVLRVSQAQVWNEPFLQIAKAVSKGAKEIELTLPNAAAPAVQTMIVDNINSQLPF